MERELLLAGFTSVNLAPHILFPCDLPVKTLNVYKMLFKTVVPSPLIY